MKQFRKNRKILWRLLSQEVDCARADVCASTAPRVVQARLHYGENANGEVERAGSAWKLLASSPALELFEQRCSVSPAMTGSGNVKLFGSTE